MAAHHDNNNGMPLAHEAAVTGPICGICAVITVAGGAISLRCGVPVWLSFAPFLWIVTMPLVMLVLGCYFYSLVRSYTRWYWTKFPRPKKFSEEVLTAG